MLGDLIAPLFETGRVNSRISASDTSFSDRTTEFLRSSQSNNYEQTHNSFSGETSNTVFTKTNASQQITTATASSNYSLAAKNTTPIDSATQIDPLTGNSATSINNTQQGDKLTGNISGQAIVGQVSPIYQFASTRVTITNPSNITFTLDYIKTPASNIELRSNNTTVPNSTAAAAINGGFFVPNTRNLVSIAVNNDRPVNNDGINDPQPLPPPKRLGLDNDVTARGTLYWDGQTNTAGVAAIRNVSELKTLRLINNPNKYWAQGGISMALKDATVLSPFSLPGSGVNRGLPQQTYNEDLRGINGQDRVRRERSAMIYDDLSNNGTGATGVDIYLIITRNPVTLGEFRSGIKQTFTTAEDGIFLDGGGSTQIKTPTFSFSGDRRTIPQIIALKSV